MDRVRHKKSNRFKFQPFAERISNIKIDVFHRVPHRYEEDGDEGSTYFSQAIQKWCTLNLTENFKAFRSEVGYEMRTLPQLINNKDKIVAVFMKHIKLQNMLSLQPVLEILSAFVKDIRYEFYEYFPEILKELISLLKLKDPEILESTFTCLANIFKYLVRELVKDLDKVLLDLAPLLNDDNPPYVRDFAAQSFAFVARKVKDRQKFLLLILQTVQSSPDILYGSSQLMFHMMCGIKGQSHSSASDLLYSIVNSFGNNAVPQKILYLLTQNIVTLYGNAISPQHSVLFPVLIKVLKEKVDRDGECSAYLKQILKITKISLQLKSGAVVQEALVPEVTSSLIRLLSSSNEKVRKLSIEICGDVLTLSRLKVPQEIASLIIVKVFKEAKEENVLLSFTDQVSGFSGFETLVLPQALAVFCSMGSTAFLRNLAKIIVEKIQPETESYNILDTPVYPINLTSSTLMLNDTLRNMLETFDPCCEVTESIVCALIIARHIVPGCGKSIAELVAGIIKKAVNSLNDSLVGRERTLFVLCAALETAQYFKRDEENCCVIDDGTVTAIFELLSKSSSILVLRAVNLLLTVFSEKISVDDGLYEKTYEEIVKLTQTPHNYVRYLALCSLQSLENLRAGEDEETERSSEILQLCTHVETIPLTINDYREKIKELQKLKFEALPPLSSEKHEMLIRYLLGVLYCNFQLLWEPVSEILATYAANEPKSFWNIFYRQLCFVTGICRDGKIPNDFGLPEMDEFLVRGVRFVRVDDKADYVNYRFLLWKSMTLFVELCEARNRDVVPLYLSFLKEEFLRTSSQHVALTVNIKQNDATRDGEEEDDKTEAETATEETASKSGSSNTIKWAVAHLNLLSKFKSPRLCHRESEMRDSFYDLLQHRNLEIQKLALECLCTYKFKYMTPYKENLRNLIDDVKFKDEIVRFQIDKENGVVQDCHREELMPVVMRILHNKMTSKGVVKRGSKGSAAHLKRSIVFRFLAGCSDSEMEIFLKMTFRTFDSHQGGDSRGFVSKMNSIDLERVNPPKKLQGIVNMADVIIEHFGGLMTTNIQRYMLNVLLTVGAEISGIYAQREKIFGGFATSVKNLRNSTADCLAKFFDRLSFPWTDDEINSVFEIFVWPNLAKLPSEGIYNPTAVLRLFSTWSENPRYHKLLARHKKNETEVTPLPFVMKLLLNDKSHVSVTSCIVSMLENLLTLKEEEEVTEENVGEEPLQLEDVLDADESRIQKLGLKEELNCGSKILLPHVASILMYLRKRLERSSSNSNVLEKSESVILSRITELATSPENADALMTILVRLLTTKKKFADEDILMSTMATVENLSKIVTSPMSYVRSLAALLSSFETIESRKILLNALMNIQRRCPNELKNSVDIVQDLNSYDGRLLNQPDFDRRVDADKKVKELAANGKLDANLALMYLHNSFHVVRCETDLSLRDSASYCAKEICPIVAKRWKENRAENQFWIDSILKLVHKGMSGESENLWFFAVSLLGVMARECGDLHPVLGDLSVYANKSDLEVDLFENAIHLQTHRRLRALLRFCSLSKTLTKAPHARSLVQFILPLATRYLCNEKYASKNNLIDAAISCLGAVCRFLPWSKYQTVLRYYLSKFHGRRFEHQKQLVKIVVAILDAFHFDISNTRSFERENAATGGEDAERDAADENALMEELNEVEGEEEQEEEKKKKKEEEEEERSGDVSYAYNSVTVLGAAEAAKVERAMSGSLLAQLTKAIGQKTHAEDTHKVNYKSLGPERDQEDVARISIAVTLIKLLQKTSVKILDESLPGIVMKLCTFLKSKMESVRRTTRETLQQIIVALGPDYLGVILNEMTSSLTKGFHLHVLTFAAHAVVQAVRDQLRPGDVDKNLPVLLEVCKNDIFGLTGEEKSVKQIQVKHKEARSSKSYRLMNLIAHHVTEKCLVDVLMPLKEVLSTAHSHKTITKCRECLRHVTLGLCANRFVSTENLFVYVYGITSESIPNLATCETVRETKKCGRKEKRDCFAIPNEPKSRTGVLSEPAKTSSRSNAHVLLEFGFQLLQFLLKKEKLKSATDFKSYLDPLGPVLVKAVQSQHVKVSTLALNCLCKMFKYALPSVTSSLGLLASELFSFLHRYAAPDLPRGETFELVLVAYKAICLVMKETNYDGIDADKLKMLLVYVEQDVCDNGRQATAFNLLKTILSKRLNAPELKHVMKKVAELSVTCDLDHVRVQARQSVLQYVMDYPLGSELESYLAFYVSQLSYDVESGRRSALEMLHTFVTSFPESTLSEHCGVFFVTLGARLVNDESSECKKAVSGIVKTMLTRLKDKHRDHLFEILELWLKDRKLAHKRLGAQLMGIYVTLEKERFAKRLPSVVPLLVLQFAGESKPGRYLLARNDANDMHEKPRDYHLFQVLSLMLKICSHCPEFLTDGKYQESVNFFVETCQSLLCHPHEWVRLAAMQFLGCVLSSIEPSKVARVLNGNSSAESGDLPFLEPRTLRDRIRSLILDHLAQFIPGADLKEDLVEQATKNLVYFARVLKDLKQTKKRKREEEEEEEEEEVGEEEDEEEEVAVKNMSVLWLIRKMRGVVNKEIAEAPTSFVVRTGVLKWIGAVAVCFTSEELGRVLYHLAAPVVRERDLCESEHSKSPIKGLVAEVTKVLKKKVGVEEFNGEAVKIRKKLVERRVERKVERAREFVTNPERAARRKMEKQAKKKILRKRKMEALKGLPRTKRRRKAAGDDEDF